MPRSYANVVCVDSGFWIALVDKRDQHHSNAVASFERWKGATLLIPWPTAYEVVSSRMAKNRIAMNILSREWARPSVVKTDDTTIRDSCLRESFEESRQMSLVDRVIRALLLTRARPVKYLATFNRKDFQDICRDMNIQIIP